MLAVAAVALVLIARSGGSSAVTPRPPAFGTFAGYLWKGPLASVDGSWRVPEVVAGSSGVASTWIGAQARTEKSAFIQIGTYERYRPRPAGSDRQPVYVTFWSDESRGFHPQPLFLVHPGDEVSASLQRRVGRWTLAILDRSSGMRATLATAEETQVPFHVAVWTQEDVGTTVPGEPEPYPRLGRIAFHGLAVDGRAPAPASLYSQWMSAGGLTYGPTPFAADSFAVVPVTLSAAGARYLQLAGRSAEVDEAFLRRLAGWTAVTPYTRIAAAVAEFKGVSGRYIDELASSPWPPGARTAAAVLAASARGRLLRLTPPAILTTAALASWSSATVALLGAPQPAALALRRALGLPTVQVRN